MVAAKHITITHVHSVCTQLFTCALSLCCAVVFPDVQTKQREQTQMMRPVAGF